MNKGDLRCGMWIVSENGPQFVSAVMQQICNLPDNHQSLIPVYHPQAYPVERKHRDLKPCLGIIFNNRHDTWSEKFPAIRFALNTSKWYSSGEAAFFLSFGRKLSTINDIINDFHGIINNDNFVAVMTKKFISRNYNNSFLKPKRSCKNKKTKVNHLQTEKGDLLLHIYLES